MHEIWIGIDIGGANLKVATSNKSFSTSFPLWKYPDRLTGAIDQLLASAGPFDRLAVTMTGELADCFECKSDGVAFICDSVAQLASDKNPVFYQTSGEFVDAERAKRNWQLTAASNWHALASLVGRKFPDCIVVDIGSTTTDIIPIRNGRPCTIGLTDLHRLQNNELVYSGVNRTPVCSFGSIATPFVLDDKPMGIAAELFATMLDVYLVLDKTAESHHNAHTADGRPADKSSARRRLAKMLCADVEELPDDWLMEFSRQVAGEQSTLLQKAIRLVAVRKPRLKTFLIAGEGAWLARAIIQEIYLHDFEIYSMFDLDDCRPNHNYLQQAAPAYAVAQLANSLVETKK